jgi:cell division protein ZapE
MTSRLLDAYEARHRRGALRPDAAQRIVAQRLQALCLSLAEVRPARMSLLARLGLGRAPSAAGGARGLYIHGPPGRGKSMLMDLFFDAAPVAAKRRVHVHAFMQEVHEQLHRWRIGGDDQRLGDPLRRLGQAISAEVRLLCFDEFQVEAIADAMILGRLFESLFDSGVVVVATSNSAPDELYRDGLQRERFLPFIELLKQRLDIVELDGATDYRRDRLKAVGVYHTPLGSSAESALEEVFAALTGSAPGTPETLSVYGRSLVVPRQAQGVACFAFPDLCGEALGPADYLRLACQYQTIILAGIPRLSPDERDIAKRFAILVETLYEQRVKLVCSAAVPPEQIYASGTGTESFRRVVSRLEEMQSEDYIAAPHRPASTLAAA